MAKLKVWNPHAEDTAGEGINTGKDLLPKSTTIDLDE
jgi:hypothetical protein